MLCMPASSFAMSSVRSLTISAALSKLTSIILSWRGRNTLWMNRIAACCSNRNCSRMLLLVSTRTARRSGRSDSAVNC